jgi:hypothetical protein
MNIEEKRAMLEAAGYTFHPVEQKGYYFHVTERSKFYTPYLHGNPIEENHGVLDNYSSTREAVVKRCCKLHQRVEVLQKLGYEFTYSEEHWCVIHAGRKQESGRYLSWAVRNAEFLERDFGIQVRFGKQYYKTCIDVLDDVLSMGCSTQDEQALMWLIGRLKGELDSFHGAQSDD